MEFVLGMFEDGKNSPMATQLREITPEDLHKVRKTYEKMCYAESKDSRLYNDKTILYVRARKP